MSFIIPIAPNATESQYKNNQPLFNQRQSDWMNKTKSVLEQSNVLSNGVAISGPLPGEIPVYFGTHGGWRGTYMSALLAAGTNVSITGTGTTTIAINSVNSLLAAGSNITISGTGTTTIALSSNVTNSFPARIAIAGTSYGIQTSDYLVAYTTVGSAGNTVNFPSPIGLARQAWVVKDEGGFAGTSKTITLTAMQGSSTYTFDGSASKVINSAYGNARIYSSGTAFFSW